jgi:hypothetical protein
MAAAALVADVIGRCCWMNQDRLQMENMLVRRDQFSITPQGIIHRPTDAAFTPNPGNPFSGIERLGQLTNKSPNGNRFSADDVRRMMGELWSEYVNSHPQLFGINGSETRSRR